MAGQGFYFPKLPPLEPKDVGILQRDGQYAKKYHNYNAKDAFISDPQLYERKAIQKYDGYTFVIPPAEQSAQGSRTKVVTEYHDMDLRADTDY